MDRSVSPADDFYRFAVGSWIRKNPVPSDKSRWGAFEELIRFNHVRIHDLLERCSAHAGSSKDPVAHEVAAFYTSAMDVDRRDELGFTPIAADLARIEQVRSVEDLSRLVAGFHRQGIDLLFGTRVYPDKKNSRVYAFYIEQGGLSLPDRDYYLRPGFARQRRAYRQHMVRMFRMLGETDAASRRSARRVLGIETELAEVSRSRTELRDEQRNYHKLSIAQLCRTSRGIDWRLYLSTRETDRLRYLIVGQPEFLSELGRLVRRRPISTWRTYARWHLIRNCAPFLHAAAEREYFHFFHTILLGQRTPEPRWQRAARILDRCIGDALGQLFVARYFPPRARARMRALIDDLREVFRARLRNLSWMSAKTRRRALAKFDRFRSKVGHPDRFRDDSQLPISAGDFLGNILRATRFEIDRKVRLLGRPVDPDDWQMTAPTVNAYFDPTQNEIVFPAGILQPPFFDVNQDDAVNYGAIGLVIGHEITHGYDDQGRHFDEHGNLRDWWSARDAREFQQRARKVVKQYDAYEALPGAHVNGALTLGENIADIGGLSIAFEALQRRLARAPGHRKLLDGLTPEQRFFVSYAQIWRQTARTAEVRRLLTVDEHSPGKFRVLGAVSNLPAFFRAFGIHEGTPMWQADDQRVAIW
jgi:putative endopeptidase